MREKQAVLRVSPELHRRVKIAAVLSETTISDWVEGVLSDALAGRPSPPVLVDTQADYNVKETHDG